MNLNDGRKREANDVGWLLLALSAASTVVYFVVSLAARGQVVFLLEAAAKVFARLGVHF